MIFNFEEKLLERIDRFLELKEMEIEMASANLAALQAVAAAITPAAAAVATYVGTLQNDQDDAALPPITAGLQTVLDQLKALVPTPPAALAVSPDTATGAVGSAVSGSATISGGTAPYSATSDAPDISASVSGDTVNFSGSPAAAEVATITVSDSATPPATATVTLTIS